MKIQPSMTKAANRPHRTTWPKLRHEPPHRRFWEKTVKIARRGTTLIALLAIAGIVLHLVLRFGFRATAATTQIPLLAVLALGGIPLVYELLKKLLHREFGSDLLAGISIVTSVLLGEYLAGSIVVLMLSGGEALENYALRSASSVLGALAKRMPSLAHRKRDSEIVDVALDQIAVGDALVIYPHEISPVDGVVIEGHGVMDESYLTGEPFQITKTSGSAVISGAINGESALTIRTTKRAQDSRYAKIMEVMRESEAKRPQLRRLGDQLGAIYTPVAVAVAIVAWAISGEAVRFLAVLVIATPCPLLIAIPVAIIGSISLCARRAIIVKSPVVLEQITECRTAIFDKTGTLTYGEPKLTEQLIASGFAQKEVLTFVASLERYSKHPLASDSRRGGNRKRSSSRRPPKWSSRPAKDCAEPFPVISCRSPAATNSSRKISRAPISFRRSLADSNVWWRLIIATRRPCAFAMRRARRVAPS